MKRKSILLAATLILSASIYAMDNQSMKGFGPEGNNSKREMRMECLDFQNKLTKLTDEQKNEIEKILKKYSPDKKKVMIDIREKEVVVDKLMIEEKIEWTKVEKALTEVAVSHSKMRLIQMKEQKEISQVTGEEMFGGDRGRRGPMMEDRRDMR